MCSRLYKYFLNALPHLYRITLLTSLSLLYYKLIRLDPILNYDDDALIRPLELIHRFSDYYQAFRNHQIWDVQPIRDLSYWLDWRIKDILPSHSFHLTNLILWLGILCLLSSILSVLRFSSGIRLFAITIYASHPVLNNSVSSLAARKHLLATLFILGATLGLIRITRSPSIGAKAIITILLLYTASIFSQPINLLWPVFAMIYLFGHQAYRRNPKPAVLLITILALVALGCGAANLAYYTGPFSSHNGISKFVPPEGDTIGIKLLAFGRYFFQSIFPAWPCQTQCYPGSLKNMIGLALFPILLLTLFKTKNREALYWALYYILPLLLVTVRMTNIFVSDTYLLNAVIGLGISALYLLRSFSRRSVRSDKLLPESERLFARRTRDLLIYAIPTITIILFSLKSFKQVRGWESNFAFWQSSFQTEPTPLNTTFYGRELLNRGDVRGAFDLAFRTSQWNSTIPGLGELYAKSLYLHPELTREQKIQIFEKIPSLPPFMSVYLHKLYDNDLTIQK